MVSRLNVKLRDDGSALYTTLDGDMVDHIAWLHYGTEFETTEAVLDANPNIAELGLALPAGLEIVLPVIVKNPEVSTRRKLWD